MLVVKHLYAVSYAQTEHTGTPDKNGYANISIGKALALAKRRYLAMTPSPLGSLHEKVLLVPTLYGLPMLSVKAKVTPASPEPGSVVPNPTSTSTDGLKVADYSLTPSLNEVLYTRVDPITKNSFTASYFTGSNGVLNRESTPILPLEIRNVSNPKNVLRGIGFRGGTFTDTKDYFPLTGNPSTQSSEGRKSFGTPVFVPTQPWNPSFLESVLNGGSTRLMVVPAQYRSGTTSDYSTTLLPVGTLRQFNKMDFRLYYTDSDPSATLGVAPVISNVYSWFGGCTYPYLSGCEVNFSASVTANLPSDINQVWITYTKVTFPATLPTVSSVEWQSVDLVRSPTDPTKWIGTLPDAFTQQNGYNVFYMVQAVSNTGLVTMVNNQGRFFQTLASYRPQYSTTTTSEVTLELPTLGADRSVQYGDTPLIRGKLTKTDLIGKSNLDNAVVTIDINGTRAQALTDVDGNFTINAIPADKLSQFPINLFPGKYVITASYAGSPGTYGVSTSDPGSDINATAYNIPPSYASSQIQVVRRQTSLMPQIVTVANSKPDLSSTCNMPGNTVILKSAGGNTLYRTRVTFKATKVGSGVKYETLALTDSKGCAGLDNSPLPEGTYNICASFEGNNLYALNDTPVCWSNLKISHVSKNIDPK